MTQQEHMTVIGAGPVGCVLAILLARRGHKVTLFEKRPDLRNEKAQAGRSINLVLTNRGLAALALVGLRDQVLELTVPVLGRMMHSVEGQLAYQPYGKDDSECNYSISRLSLNQFLLRMSQEAGVELIFEQKLADINFETQQLTFEHEQTGKVTHHTAHRLFGTDGAPSKVRRCLTALDGFDESSQLIDYGYKELTFNAAQNGEYAMAGHALHIWPRGEHMLMGLANLDGSFTGTIYLPWKGPNGFDALQDPESVETFFQTFYPDAIPLLDNHLESFQKHPTGILGTVRCQPWYLEDKVLLVGDAAHAIVPFFGQGLNCGLEDCAVLNQLLDDHGDDFGLIFSSFNRLRKPNTEAIADMALENFVEMRDRVGDPRFLLKKKVERLIEQAMPELYRSRYATVMYSDNPYKLAQDAGKIQQEIFDQLLLGIERPQDVDMDVARTLIQRKLTPFYERHHMSLNF